MNSINKNRILNYISNAGLKTTNYFYLESRETEELQYIIKKLEFPVRIIAGNEKKTYSKLVNNSKEFMMNALVFLSSFSNILVCSSNSNRVKKSFSKDEIASYKDKKSLEQLYFSLGVNEFIAYGYIANGEFYFEEIVLPDEIDSKNHVS